jgi:hypothetical protein
LNNFNACLADYSVLQGFIVEIASLLVDIVVLRVYKVGPTEGRTAVVAAAIALQQVQPGLLLLHHATQCQDSLLSNL